MHIPPAGTRESSVTPVRAARACHASQQIRDNCRPLTPRHRRARLARDAAVRTRIRHCPRPALIALFSSPPSARPRCRDVGDRLVAPPSASARPSSNTTCGSVESSLREPGSARLLSDHGRHSPPDFLISRSIVSPDLYATPADQIVDALNAGVAAQACGIALPSLVGFIYDRRHATCNRKKRCSGILPERSGRRRRS